MLLTSMRPRVGLAVALALVAAVVAAPPASATVPSRVLLNMELESGQAQGIYGCRPGIGPAQGYWNLGLVPDFWFGGAASDLPIVGDWDGDGFDSIGVFRQSTAQVFLRNSNTTGVADEEFWFGAPGDLPVAGDWNVDGIDTIGTFRPSNGKIYLRNENTTGSADIEFYFGAAGDEPTAGDFDGDGVDTIALFRNSNLTMYIRNSNSLGPPDEEFAGFPGHPFTVRFEDSDVAASDFFPCP